MPLANSSVIHPRLFTSMPQFFPSLCSIYQYTPMRNPIGERIETPPDAALPGTLKPFLEQIPCAVGDSQSLRRKQISEERTSDSTFEDLLIVIMLAGSFPSITTKMRAVADGIVYDIRAVSLSMIGSHTELIVEEITI